VLSSVSQSCSPRVHGFGSAHRLNPYLFRTRNNSSLIAHSSWRCASLNSTSAIFGRHRPIRFFGCRIA
jgi:hypothetical protein